MQQVVLIGNYPPDKQESMERFARMLNSGFSNCGLSAEIWRPNVLFGRFARSTNYGLGKWLGYMDKYILFPVILKSRVRGENRKSSNVLYHVCDHSNAIYLKYLPANRSGITCHDVLAIRGALGYTDAACPASFFGRILQKWILRNLLKAKLIASVSQHTLDQLKRLTINKGVDQKKWRVIHNAFNAEFKPMNATDAMETLSKAGLEIKVPFLLHVGSDLPRKNRKLLIDMAAALDASWNGQICFAGTKGVEKTLIDLAASMGLQNRIIDVHNPDHATLVALYSSCEAFIFPSISEGFGWPLIEAQACGAPVVASNVQPMPEVSGGAALHVDPYNAFGFSRAFLSLTDENYREKIIQQGLQNSLRFNAVKMIEAYLNLYGLKAINNQKNDS